MNQDRNRDQGTPKRSSNMESGEESREDGNTNKERGRGTDGERNRMDSGSRGRNSGGITNRPLDRERSEQEQIPERGESQSER